MADKLDQLSDDELLAMAGSVGGNKNLDSMTDEELIAAAGEQDSPSTLDDIISGLGGFGAGLGQGVMLGTSDIGTFIGDERAQKLKEDNPFLFPAGEVVGNVASAFALPEVAAPKLAGKMLAGGAVGGAIGAAQDLDKSLPIEDRIKNAALGAAGGAAGPGVMALGGKALKFGGNVLKKAASAASGIPETVMDTFRNKAPYVKKMSEEAGGNIQEAADKIRQSVQDSIAQKRGELSAIISEYLDNKGQNLKLDATKMRDELAKKLGSLNPSSPSDRNQAKDLFMLADELVAHSNKDGTINASQLYKLNRKLDDYASSAYGGNSIFENTTESARFAKKLSGIARNQINKNVPEIRAANTQYSKLHNIDEKINKNLINPEKSPAALLSAGRGNELNKKMLGKIGAATGNPVLPRAKLLAAMEAFDNPQLYNLYSTGRSLLGATVGGAAGGAYGQSPESASLGALLGAGIGSPAAIKAALLLANKIPQVSINPRAIGALSGSSADAIRRLKALED